MGLTALRGVRFPNNRYRRPPPAMLSVSLPLAEAPAAQIGPSRAAHRPWWLIVSVAAILTASIALRCYRLGNIPGVNGDEAWSGAQAVRLLHGQPVEWRTPNGNPINPFFFLPTLALHVLWPPSIVLLRVVPLASGLAALAVNYWLCRRAFDSRTAVISTCLLAVLPIDIAYSRFAWDASQSLLMTLGVVYLPLIEVRRRGEQARLSVGAIAALAAAILVHPTNVFDLPLVVLPPLVARRRQVVQLLRNTVIPARGWALAALAACSVAIAFFAAEFVTHFARWHGPGEWNAFAGGYWRLFSGTTIYAFITGLGLNAAEDGWFGWLPPACDALAAIVAVAAVVGLTNRWRRGPDDTDRALATSWAAVLIGFWLVAGPRALEPHHERYAICLVGVTGVLSARGLAWWLEDARRRVRLAATVGLSLAAWLALASFWCGYFEFIETIGGRSHATFRTAATEPKQAALDWIRGHRDARLPAVVVCHEFWNYWPLAYLAADDAQLQVVKWDEWRMHSGAETLEAGQTWFVEFAGTGAEAEALAALESDGTRPVRHVVRDYGGREVLTVIGPVEKSSQNY